MNRFILLGAVAFPCLFAGCGTEVASRVPIPSVSLNSASYDFGSDLVGHALTSVVVQVTNTGQQPFTMAPSVSGDPSFSVYPGLSTCGTTVAVGGTCAVAAQYLPTVGSGASAQMASLNLGLLGATASTTQTIALSGTSIALATGTVTKTNNPQVALYTMMLPSAGSITVSFGQTTVYGHQTWTRSTTSAGPVSVFVAGMLANTAYHMQAQVSLTNGLVGSDVDHTFTTGAPSSIPQMTATTTSGMTPQPGLEQMSILGNVSVGLVVTDLNANVLWSYLPSAPASEIEGAKMLPNGDFLVSIGQGSNYLFNNSPLPSTATRSLREVDLGNDVIREITIPQLTAKLTAAGYNIPLQEFHHDVTPLPNGHWLALASTAETLPVTGLGTIPVLGDVVIDLDTNLNPVWVWNEFDHLDVNRHPLNFPDWTHTNAVLYSPDDGNLVISMRDQNWVIKVDYKNGTGAGDILWRLGEGGDFTLKNGTDPTDWAYAQHFPAFFSKNTSGSFSLGLMDNGDDRAFPAGVTCGATGEPACTYTTIPVFQIDEGAKTATLTSHQILPTSLYNTFGGNTDLLGNGDIEYDLCGVTINGSYINSDVFEVTQTSTPQTVWQMQIRGSAAYRAYRIPSLYPGVQWQ